MAGAFLARDFRSYQMYLQAAVDQGAIYHTRSGLAAYYKPLNSAVAGTSVDFQPFDIVTATKPTGIVFLDGGPVYWNPSSNQTNFKRLTNSQEFFLGTAFGDALTGDTTMGVMLNFSPPPLYYDFDLARDTIIPPVITGTQGLNTMGVFRIGGAHQMIMSTASEVQKMDTLGQVSWAAAAPCIIEMELTIAAGGAAAEPDFNVGIASATHATDADSIAQHLFCHIDGNSTNINFQSKDGTNTTAATDSTTDYTTGTPFQVWFDCRTPSSVKIYVNAVRVLSSTTFNIGAAASAWFLLAHLEKTSSATVFQAYVNYLRMRNATQSVNGV